LFDTITSSPTVLEPGQNATLTIIVRNSTAPQAGTNLTFTTPPPMSWVLSQPVPTGIGIYQVNFTAPPPSQITSTVIITVQVTASLTGYLGATNQTSITVNPFPLLTVAVSPKPSSITPGQGQTTVVVNGVPNLTTLKVSGIPIFLLVAGGVILFLLILAVLVRKKKSDYHHIAPQSSFSY